MDLSAASRVGLTLLLICMCLVGYFLMLLVMTFNVGVIFMISLGLAIGQLGFEIIGLPELPPQYKQIAGSGAYMPMADNCCNKIECCSHAANNECHAQYQPNGYDHLMRHESGDGRF